ncbi:unnamed protein product, partial [marine sediment metagenome]
TVSFGFLAPGVGFEPTTCSLHLIQYFHIGADYLIALDFTLGREAL